MLGQSVLPYQESMWDYFLVFMCVLLPITRNKNTKQWVISNIKYNELFWLQVAWFNTVHTLAGARWTGATQNVQLSPVREKLQKHFLWQNWARFSCCSFICIEECLHYISTSRSSALGFLESRMSKKDCLFSAVKMLAGL